MAKASKEAAPKKSAVKKKAAPKEGAAKKSGGSKSKKKKPKNPQAGPGEFNSPEQAAGADGFPSSVAAYDGE